LLLGEGQAESQGLVALMAYLSVAGVLGGLAFFVVAYLLRVQEIRALWHRGCAWGRDLIEGSG
jgi:hypothetical protein